MGNVKLGLLLFIVMSSSSPILKGLCSPSDSLKDIDLREKDILQDEKYDRSVIAHHDGFGAHTGGSTGSGEHKPNGGPGSPYLQGGAESNHHPNIHHGAGSCNQNCVQLVPFIIMTGVASLVQLYKGLQN